jgi:hypothetical protein
MIESAISKKTLTRMCMILIEIALEAEVAIARTPLNFSPSDPAMRTKNPNRNNKVHNPSKTLTSKSMLSLVLK